MRIKIISEGTGKDTKIINIETGELVEGVRSVEWRCSVNTLATAILEFVNVPVEIEGETE